MSTPALEHIRYRDLKRYLVEAQAALLSEGEEDAAHYFEMLHTTVSEWTPGKPFKFNTKDLGL